MKYIKFAFVLIVLSTLLNCKKEQTLPLHNKKVLILGNSITQNGKYVDFLEYYLRKNHPKAKLDIISIGLSSETASGDSEANHPFPRPCIHTRLDAALQAIKPDLVLACYGMNDGIYSNLDQTRFEAYKGGILKLKTKVEAQGASLILLTPTPFDPNSKKEKLSMDGEEHSFYTPYYKYNDVLETYANWLINRKDDTVPVIDLHHYVSDKLADIKKTNTDSTFIPDAVHPNTTGHFYMAKKILTDLYPNIEIGEPQIEIKKLNQDSLYTLVSKRRKTRSGGWLKFVGYTKKNTVKSDDISSTKKHVNDLDKKIKILQNN